MKVLKSFLGILAFLGILLGVGVGECFAQAAHTGGDFRAGVRIPIINIAGGSVAGMWCLLNCLMKPELGLGFPCR